MLKIIVPKLRLILATIFLFFSNIAPTIYATPPTHVTSFSDIVEPLMPTVVNIYTVKYSNQTTEKDSVLTKIIPLDRVNSFFKQFNVPFSFEDLYSNPMATSLGSGFIVDSDGYIITNNHVVANSDEIYIKLSDNTELPAQIVGTDSKTDLALLKIDVKHKLPFVSFANSDQSRIGDVVIAIGNPLGFGGTVTSGIISSKGRDLGNNKDELVDNFIQTDAAINIGNSGGPLYNIEGKVIGLNTAIANFGSANNFGIGFAIPSNLVQDIMAQLKEKGKISRGRLDIAIQEVTKDLADALSLDNTQGVLIVDVRSGGAGEKSGFKCGDLIIEFNGKKVLNSRKLQLLVAETNIGDEVKTTVIRDNNPVTIMAKIVEPEQQKLVEVIDKNKVLQKSDIVFSDLSTELRTQLGLNETIKGVAIIKINEQHNTDLKTGDVVIRVNQQTIENIKQFDEIYENAKNENKKNILLLIKRKDLAMFVAMSI